MNNIEKEITLGKLTRKEFRERMQSGELEACLIPVAAIEQHLEHLAMEHDWRSVKYITQTVAKRLAPRVLIAEGINVRYKRTSHATPRNYHSKSKYISCRTRRHD